MSNKSWRDIEVGKQIFKFNSKKEHQTLVLTFKSEGTIKSFKTPQFNEAHVIIGYKEAESVEFEAELNGKTGTFSTGSSRLLNALKNVSDNLVDKRIKMEKNGVDMDTMYSAKLVK